ncbi:MAG: PQQ-binding-like beta-propeller repeat protein, partial [Chloroflexi bacterium]|nr:PQQ-binding-like beta-propeller repeat protein [Chloroflexota bacterium]
MMRKILVLLISFLLLIVVSTQAQSVDLSSSSLIPVDAEADLSQLANENSWPMAGGNPERTSWTPEEVRGSLDPLWYKPIEPYISQKVQIIAVNGTLYISTAKGLYTLDADTGAEGWVYPTEMPLGHSPTVANGVVYVGGLDRKLHAIDATTGQGLWTFEEAKAGYQTNPLVVNGVVYAGNRDGYFYAVDAATGQLDWKYKTGGPVLFSAAYKDDVLFFASEDSYAYALNATDGSVVWQSSKLPGAGFQSWWPVIYQDRVIFAGSNNYRTNIRPGGGKQITQLELDDVYPNHKDDPRKTLPGVAGFEPGDWASGTATIDMSKPNVTANGSTTAVTEYLEAKPWRRTYFVLDRATGNEITYDFDNDNNLEYAPILWVGTHSGTRYPPVVGGDDVIYQSNNFYSDTWIAGGHISGWKIDTPFISVPDDGWNAVDEPQAYSAGGNLLYWNRCCDRVGESIDLNHTGNGGGYFSYNLEAKISGYNDQYHMSDTKSFASFGAPSINGINGYHGDNNPPIPYQNKIFMHRGNSIIAFADTNNNPVTLPMFSTVTIQDIVQPFAP